MPRTFSLYDVLGIKKAATDDDIRKAYKRKALETHPDRAPKDEPSQERAAEAFRAVSAAYEVLSDPAKRRHYDIHGDEEPEYARRPPPPPRSQSTRPESTRQRPPPPPPRSFSGAAPRPQQPEWDRPPPRRSGDRSGYSSDPETAPRRPSRPSSRPSPRPPPPYYAPYVPKSTRPYGPYGPPPPPPPIYASDPRYYGFYSKMYACYGGPADSPYRQPFGDPYQLFERMFADVPRDRWFEGTQWMPPPPMMFPPSWFGIYVHAYPSLSDHSWKREKFRRARAVREQGSIPPPRPPPLERRQYYATSDLNDEPEEYYDGYDEDSSRSPSPEPMWEQRAPPPPPPMGMPPHPQTWSGPSPTSSRRRRRANSASDGVPVPPLSEAYCNSPPYPNPYNGPPPPPPHPGYIYTAHPAPNPHRHWSFLPHIFHHGHHGRHGPPEAEPLRFSTPPPQPTYQRFPTPPPHPTYAYTAPPAQQEFEPQHYSPPKRRSGGGFEGLRSTLFSPSPEVRTSPLVRGMTSPEARRRGRRSNGVPGAFSPDYNGGRYMAPEPEPYQPIYS